MTRIRETLKCGEMGHWQYLFRAISAANSFDKGFDDRWTVLNLC